MFHPRSWLARASLFMTLVLVPWGPRSLGIARGISQGAVLHQLLDRAGAATRVGKVPVVVFDLDDTLFRVGNRTKQILLEYARSQDPVDPAMVSAFQALDTGHMYYALKDNLAVAGVTDPVLVRRIHRVWGDRFFSSDMLHHDIPTAGAVDFVRRLRERGAHVVYLTGRDEPRMLSGTVATLRQAGFPVEVTGTTLILKPGTDRDDMSYKEASLARIRSLGEVVASFDNEPRNVNMFRSAFPGALVIFLDTVWSPGSPPVRAGIIKIKDFRLD